MKTAADIEKMVDRNREAKSQFKKRADRADKFWKFELQELVRTGRVQYLMDVLSTIKGVKK